MRIKITLAIVFFTTSLFSQNFEGKLVYKNTCSSTSPTWKPEYCALMIDSLEVYYFKDGDYKYDTEGTGKWTLFKKNENKTYSKGKKKEVIYRNDPSEVSEFDITILDIQITKKAATILGYECDELVLKSEGLIQKYYFNSITSIDPKLLENHKKGHLSKIISITKAIPLQIIVSIESQNLTLESVAVEITKTTLDKSIFEVPKNIEIIDSN